VWPHAELNRAAGGGLSQPTRQAPPFVQHPVAGHVTALWTQDAAGRPPEALSVLVVGVWDLHPVAYPCQVVLR